MKEFKGTKVEWRIKSTYNGWHRIENSPVEESEENIANAKLISAAPCLLDALQNLLGSLNSYDENDQSAINQAEAAINKALSINN